MTHDRLAFLIKDLLDYNWEDELHDYKVNHLTENSTHIFNLLVELDNYLTGEEKTPESWLANEN